MFVEIMVGTPPDWYDEVRHDFWLEKSIRRKWFENSSVTDVDISYVYNGDHIAIIYNEEGEVIEKRVHDLSYAFEYAKRNG